MNCPRCLEFGKIVQIKNGWCPFHGSKYEATGGIIDPEKAKAGIETDYIINIDPTQFSNIISDALNKFTVKNRIIALLNKQTAKGVEKYGHTLDDCPDDKFDWKLMAMEEMIDLIQYQQKEIIRLERLLNPTDG